MTSLRIRIRFIQACSILCMLCASAAMPARQVGAATTTAAATTAPDVCGYPDGSNLPRSAAIFNESAVLRAFSPVSTTTTARGQGLTIKMWYNDEHALTLGVRRVVVKSSSGTTTTDYPITPLNADPVTHASGATNPQVGTTFLGSGLFFPNTGGHHPQGFPNCQAGTRAPTRNPTHLFP